MLAMPDMVGTSMLFDAKPRVQPPGVSIMVRMSVLIGHRDSIGHVGQNNPSSLHPGDGGNVCTTRNNMSGSFFIVLL